MQELAQLEAQAAIDAVLAEKAAKAAQKAAKAAQPKRPRGRQNLRAQQAQTAKERKQASAHARYLAKARRSAANLKRRMCMSESQLSHNPPTPLTPTQPHSALRPTHP